MDYPKSDAGARLYNGKFTDGDPVNNIPPSKDSAVYQNMVFDELINVIESANITPNHNSTNQLQTAIQQIINGSRYNDSLNINGNFSVWQRGTSFTASGDEFYTADRHLFSGQNGSCSVNQGNFLVEENKIPYNPSHYLRWQIHNTNGNSTYHIRQENGNQYSNQPLTVSFWGRCINNSGTLLVSQAMEGDLASQIGSIDLADEWQFHQVSFSSLTTSAVKNYFEILFTPDATSNEIHLAQIKLEYGDKATKFFPRTEAEELQLCSRYYQTLNFHGLQFSGHSSWPHVVHNHVFTPPMRTAPTIEAPMMASNWQPGGATSNNNGEASSITDRRVFLIAYVNSQPDHGVIWPNNIEAGSELIRFDAEL